MDLKLSPIDSRKIKWLFSDDGLDAKRGCIGHLRGDFGYNGKEFWTSWFDHIEGLKTQEFRNELQDVVNGMREEGGLLNSFSSMRNMCRTGTPVDDDVYGFVVETPNYEYCLRCIVRKGDYNFYLYCYDKNVWEE